MLESGWIVVTLGQYQPPPLEFDLMLVKILGGNQGSHEPWGSSVASTCPRLNQKRQELSDMKEEWRPVVGSEGAYSVSNLGRIRSNKNERIMKASGEPYLIINFRYSGKKISKTVHSVVFDAFNGSDRNGFVIDHIDGNRKNNRAENLRLLTSGQNIFRAKKGNSVYRGVHWCKAKKKFIAEGSRWGRKKSLGQFDCDLLAAFEVAKFYKDFEGQPIC
jgi:hypothetical protein